jgi:hypothetical protein
VWAEKFDQQFTDIFAIQDRVSQQVVQSLWVKLSPTTPRPCTISTTLVRPATLDHSTLSIDLFKKAIELDPEYALAHAQLGYTYTNIAVFQEDNPSLIELRRNELVIAERIDPQLPEVHLARSFIAFSQ